MPNGGEILSPQFPGERLLVCLNPRLRQQRARKREDLLQATEAKLTRIATAARKHKPGAENRRTLKALGREAHRRRVFPPLTRAGSGRATTGRSRPSCLRHLRGPTNLEAQAIDSHQAVAAYKSLPRSSGPFDP